MHLQTLLVLPYLVIGSFADMHDLEGSFSKFKVQAMKSETDATKRLYDGCQELDQHGEIVSSDKVCVAQLLKNTLQDLDTSLNLENGKANLASNGTTFDKESLLEESSTSTSTKSFKVTVSESVSEPTAADTYGENDRRADGLGSAILLKREEDRVEQTSPRRHKFYFPGGAWGVKVQMRKLNDFNVSSSDLDAWANGFGYGNGQEEPLFKESDSWKFAICDKHKRASVVGKIISLDAPSDDRYEPYEESMDCS